RPESSSGSTRSCPARRGARCAISCVSRSSSRGRKRLPRPPGIRKKSLEFAWRVFRIKPVDVSLMRERRKHLEFLRQTAREAIWSGDYERALTLYDDGLSLARSWKDRD